MLALNNLVILLLMNSNNRHVLRFYFCKGYHAEKYFLQIGTSYSIWESPGMLDESRGRSVSVQAVLLPEVLA